MSLGIKHRNPFTKDVMIGPTLNPGEKKLAPTVKLLYCRATRAKKLKRYAF